MDERARDAILYWQLFHVRFDSVMTAFILLSCTYKRSPSLARHPNPHLSTQCDHASNKSYLPLPLHHLNIIVIRSRAPMSSPDNNSTADRSHRLKLTTRRPQSLTSKLQILHRSPSSLKQSLKTSARAVLHDTLEFLERSPDTYTPPKPSLPPNPVSADSPLPGEQASQLRADELCMSGALPDDDCCAQRSSRRRCVTGSCGWKGGGI